MPAKPRKGYLKFQVALYDAQHAVARYSQAYTPEISRLPEIYFSGSLLIKQGVGWVDKPNIP